MATTKKQDENEVLRDWFRITGGVALALCLVIGLLAAGTRLGRVLERQSLIIERSGNIEQYMEATRELLAYREVLGVLQGQLDRAKAQQAAQQKQAGAPAPPEAKQDNGQATTPAQP